MRLKSLILLLCLTLGSAFAQTPQPMVLTPQLDSVVREVLELNRQQRYQEVIRRLASEEEPILKLFRAMNLMAQYDEYTTSHSLNQSIAVLETLMETFKASHSQEDYPFWRGFAQLQRGFAYELQGESVNSALLIREGALQLSKLDGNSDAQALYAIYQYYLGGLTSKLPWVDDRRAEHLQVIEKSIYQSKYFSDLYRTTAIWIHYDLGNYEQGLKLARSFLKRYPKHRIYRTIEGDMLRKLKRYQESLNVYQSVHDDYHSGSMSKGVRALSALGNIVLLKHYLKQLDADDLDHRNFLGRLPLLRDKMPESLLDELQKQDLIP